MTAIADAAGISKQGLVQNPASEKAQPVLKFFESIARSAAQCFRTLPCILSAVALSIDTTIAWPRKPRPRKCLTMSRATVSNRSSRVKM